MNNMCLLLTISDEDEKTIYLGTQLLYNIYAKSCLFQMSDILCLRYIVKSINLYILIYYMKMRQDLKDHNKANIVIKVLPTRKICLLKNNNCN